MLSSLRLSRYSDCGWHSLRIQRVERIPPPHCNGLRIVRSEIKCIWALLIVCDWLFAPPRQLGSVISQSQMTNDQLQTAFCFQLHFLRTCSNSISLRLRLLDTPTFFRTMTVHYSKN